MAGAGWKRYCELAFEELDLGLRVDLSRLGLDAARLDAYDAPMRAAFDAMQALEAGAIANPDEGRMVGHYWLRAPERAPAAGLTAAIRDAQTRIIEFARRVHDGEVRPERAPHFRRVLLIGIGGSALGPQLVAEALGTPQDRLALHFLDNTDPDGFDRVLAAIGPALAETLAIVISKSGGTPETRNGMLEVARAYRTRGLHFGAHAVAITQDGSALARYAHDHGFVAQFPMWDWVGGRTSVTSAVGLLPAALQGVDVRALLDGAAAMDEATRRHDSRRNPAALLAAGWHFAADGRGAKDMVVLPYKDRFLLLSRYLQQLVMESLGKERDLEGRVVNQGLTVYGNKGSTDQHAYVQQLREGVPNFFAMFVRVLQDREGPSPEVESGVTSGDYLDGFLLGTRQALADNHRPSLTITIPRVDAHALGGLIALFERTVGFYASLVGINAYHQPGVEAGKKAASAILALQGRAVKVLEEAGGEALGAEDVARRAGHPDEAETVLLVLEHLAANPGRGVRRRPGRTLCDATFSWVGTD